MGLWDKIKGKASDVMKQTQPAKAPEPEPEEVEEEMEAADDDGEADDFGGWDPNNWEEFWYKVHKIEEAGNRGGDDAYEAACRQHGLRDSAQLQRVRDTFGNHFGHIHEFVQAAMNARSRQGKEMLGAAAASNQAIMAPVEGVTLETYAAISARRASVADVQGLARLLGEYGLDQAKFARVDAEWQKRMSGQGASDPNATYALLTEYGKFFAMAGQGGHAAAAQAAQANAGAIGLGAQQHGKAPVGGEPCTLEQFAEIMAAQGAWAEQGRDVNAMLKKQFNLTAIDWSNLGAYWNVKIGSDYRIGAKLGELMDKYKARYSTPGQDDDLNV